MKFWKRFARFFIASLPCILLCANANSQEQKAPPPASELQTIKPPEHPVTEKQLSTYYDVSHIPSFSHQLTHEKMEVQRKQLPEWYLQSVWDEIEDAIDNIDLPKVALPVYQKYLSEDDAELLIRLTATPQGQKLVQSVLAKDARAQHAGTAPELAREQALADLARNEGEEVERIFSGMSPKDRRDLESNSVRLEQLKPVLVQMRNEASQATLNEQSRLSKAIVTKHQSELVEAKRSYDASHPKAPSSQTPQ
jgi:DNA-binding MarR family transcriptional regulator